MGLRIHQQDSRHNGVYDEEECCAMAALFFTQDGEQNESTVV